MLRRFSTSCSSQARLGRKLKELVNAKDDSEQIAQRRRQRKEQQQAKIKAYQQNKETEPLLHRHLEEYLSSVENVIKTKPVFAVKHPAVYKYLGTSKAQLQNPYTVSDEVSRLLKKKNVARAVFIIRLAGKNGSVGMNQVLKYLTASSKHSLALKLMNKMKKWGARETELTNVSLIEGPNTKHSTKKIVQTFEKAKENINVHDRKKQTLNSNATMTALARKGDMEAIAELYDELEFRDKFTYTTVLNAIGRRTNAIDYAYLANKVWSDVEHDVNQKHFRLDGPLIRAYASAGGSVSENAARKALQLMNENFNVSGKGEQQFKFGEGELDVMLKLYYKLGRYRDAMELFERCKAEKMKIDWPHYSYYVKCISQAGNTERAKKVLAEFKTATSNFPPSVIYADLTRTFANCQPDKFDGEVVEDIKKAAQNAWGKRPHIALVNAYATVFANAYSKNLDTLHPRHGLKALNDIARSYQVFAHNLSDQKYVQECREAMQSIVQLGNKIYSHEAWKKHRFIWVQKMTEMCDTFSKQLENDEISAKSIEEFVFDMDTIVRRGQDKPEATPVLRPIREST